MIHHQSPIMPSHNTPPPPPHQSQMYQPHMGSNQYPQQHLPHHGPIQHHLSQPHLPPQSPMLLGSHTQTHAQIPQGPQIHPVLATPNLPPNLSHISVEPAPPYHKNSNDEPQMPVLMPERPLSASALQPIAAASNLPPILTPPAPTLNAPILPPPPPPPQQQPQQQHAPVSSPPTTVSVPSPTTQVTSAPQSPVATVSNASISSTVPSPSLTTIVKSVEKDVVCDFCATNEGDTPKKNEGLIICADCNRQGKSHDFSANSNSLSVRPKISQPKRGRKGKGRF